MTRDKIYSFRGDIYFVSQNEAQKLFLDVVESFVEEIDAKHTQNISVQRKKIEALDALFEVMQKNDLVAMADALVLYALPLLGD